jgi:hypothetical protein
MAVTGRPAASGGGVGPAKVVGVNSSGLVVVVAWGGPLVVVGPRRPGVVVVGRRPLPVVVVVDAAGLWSMEPGAIVEVTGGEEGEEGVI